MLDIVHILIRGLLSAGKEGLVLLVFALLPLRGGSSSVSLGVKLLHLGLSSLRNHLFGFLLLSYQLLVVDQILLCLDSGAVFDPGQLIFADDNGIVLAFLLSLTSDLPQLVHGDNTGLSSNVASSLLATEQSVVDG